MSESKVVFVGAGPGDPDLITVKGKKILDQADVVVYAGSLVNRELLAGLKEGAECFDSASLTLDEAVAIMVPAARAGKKVVRLHTGDPSLYGAIQEQMEALQAHQVDYEVVPGVTAAFAAAASIRQELTLPGVSQTVILTRIEGRTPVPEKEKLAKIAAIGATTCLYLSVGMIDKVVSELLAGAYSEQTPVAVVSRASWDDEMIVEGTLADIAAKVKAAGLTRQALIIVGESLAARSRGLREKSKLYDASFAHGFRTGKEE
ncbi:MAG: precorrin-4 C(11)-methyltransferase [Desulfuromonas sp.]|mgnify:CR=1 FL=1|nr:MAG: precorrin-4 C(11)-methyltransferase [Desulfuromonas sp.]